MRAGEVLVVRSPDGPDRKALVLQVLGVNGGPPFLVRWLDTGRTGELVPQGDVVVDHHPPPPSVPDHRCG